MWSKGNLTTIKNTISILSFFETIWYDERVAALCLMISFENPPEHSDEDTKISPQTQGEWGSNTKDYEKSWTSLPFSGLHHSEWRIPTPRSPYITNNPNDVAILWPTISNKNNEIEVDILRARALAKWWSPANPWSNPDWVRKVGEIWVWINDTKAQASWIKNYSDSSTIYLWVRADANPGDTPSMKLEVALRHDIRRFLEPETPNPERRAFLLYYGIDIPESELSDPKMVKYAMMNFSLANLSLLNPEEGETKWILAGLGIEVRWDTVRVTDQWYCEYLGWSVDAGWGFANGGFHPSVTLSWRAETRSQNLTQAIHTSISPTETRISLETATQIEWNQYTHTAWVKLGASSRYGLHGIAEYSFTNEKGRSRSIWLWYSTKGGPMIEIGRKDLLAGSRNIVRTLSLLGSSTRVYYTPGYHWVDKRWDIYAYQDGILQFFHRAPEIQWSLDRIQSSLIELSKTKQVTVEKDFAKKLDTKTQVEAFAIFLEKHMSLFLNSCPYEQIRFTSQKIPSGIESDEPRSQLRISDIGEAVDVRATISSRITPPEGEHRLITEKTKALGLRVRTRLPLTPELSRGIDAFISHIEQTSETSRLRGKNIVIREDTIRAIGEDLPYETVTASGYYQEITLCVSTLSEIGRAYMKQDKAKSLPSKDYELLSRWVDPATLYQITDFAVIPDRDPRLQREQWEWTTSATYSADNGSLYISETFWRDIVATLDGKKREDLSWWGRMKLQTLLSMVDQAKVRNLEYIKEKSNKVLESSRDALKHLNQEINGTTLYQSVPLSESDGTYTYRIEEVGSLKVKWIFRVRIGDNRQVELDMGNGEKYTFGHINDESASALFSRYPWMRTLLFWNVIIDNALDRKRHIPGVLAEIYAKERKRGK